MPAIIETEVFQFDELNDSAKERARQWFREGDLDQFWSESVIEDFARIADLLGVDLATHPVQLMSGKTRHDVSVWWQLSYSQGDYASFDGSYRYKRGAAKAVRDYAPQDERLHRIADDLQAIQKRYSYGIRAKFNDSSYYGLQIEVERENGGDLQPEDEQGIKDAFRALARWLYDMLRKEDEYQSSDEVVDDNIRANEYTFTEDGERFG